MRNETDFEIVFIVGKKSFTISAGQSTRIKIESRKSIEVRPRFLGISSSFIVGGLKKDAAIECTVDEAKNGNKHKLLLRPMEL